MIQVFMSKRALQLERLLIYVWGIMFPWQTVWIYRTAFINGSVWQYGTLGLYVSEAVLCLLCTVTIFNFRSVVDIKKPDKKIFGKRLLYLSLFLAFPCFALVSVLWSQDADISVRHALYLIEGYLLLTTIVVSRVQLGEWLRAFLVGSIAPIVLGLFQWFSQSTFSSTVFGLSEHVVSNPGTSIVASETIGRWLRAYGTFPHPNIFAGYLVFVLLCTFLFKLYTEKLRDRVLVVVIHILGVFTLCATFSRSALLGYLFLCIGFFLYALKQHFRALLPLFVGTFFCVVFFGIFYHDVLFTRTIPISVSETRSIAERTHLLHVAWELHLDQPVLGFGGGLFTYAWYIADSQLSGYLYQPVHVALFVILVEYGWLGTLLLGVSFGLVVWLWYRQSGRNNILFFFSGIAPFVLISFFDHYSATLYPGILIFSAYLSMFFRFSTGTPQSVHKI